MNLFAGCIDMRSYDYLWVRLYFSVLWLLHQLFDPHDDVHVLRTGSHWAKHAKVLVVEEVHDQDAARTFS